MNYDGLHEGKGRGHTYMTSAVSKSDIHDILKTRQTRETIPGASEREFDKGR